MPGDQLVHRDQAINRIHDGEAGSDTDMIAAPLGQKTCVEPPRLLRGPTATGLSVYPPKAARKST